MTEGLLIGPLHVRRSILIEAPPAQVWASFASFAEIHRWLGQGHQLHELEPQLGGRVRLSVELEQKEAYFGGQVVRCIAERELSVEIEWESSDFSFGIPTFWTYRLTPMYEGTQVEFFHHGFERLGLSAGDMLAGYEEGWAVTHLMTLREIVKG